MFLSLLSILAVADVAVAGPPKTVKVYDPVEITVTEPVPPGNPFTDAKLTAEFGPVGKPAVKVDGFCDAADGKTFRVRFLPTEPGEHRFTLSYTGGSSEMAYKGTFTAVDAKQRGPVRVDPKYPWHFVYDGTGEHYFWNGTTTYWLLGWTDEAVIRGVIDRLASKKVNRIRVALNGRTTDGKRWDEPVVNTDTFRFRLNPFVAARPDSVADPGFDKTRFDVAYWQKLDRLLAHAKSKGVQVSLLFFLDGQDPGVDPFGKANAGGEDERRYYRYAVARCAAYANVMWDVTNEYHLFRTEQWVNDTGTFLKGIDPYKHSTSVHGNAGYKFRTSPWSDFAMYQSWDESGGHKFILNQRKLQAATGRPIPQVNEEYGYEDHYPTKWGGGKKAPARSGDNRRRLAWGMYMAGGYQSTGERADTPAGGGWINGRGDASMTMLDGYAHIVDCFTALEWWKMDPHDELGTDGAFVLAEPGKQYLAYLPAGKPTTLTLDGTFTATWFNCRTGARTPIGAASGTWTTPKPADDGDWAVVLK